MLKRRRQASTGTQLTYAVGDIHGRRDLFERLLERIYEDAATLWMASRPRLVLVGDYIDRGPDSRGVLDLISDLRDRREFVVDCIMGNHEEAMLAFLADENMGPSWMHFGGLATLASYGVEAPRSTDPSAWLDARDALDDALPAPHFRLLHSLKYMVQIGDYAFVHAGVRPGVPFNEQDPRDTRWIRGPFLEHAGPFEKVVVHGHTPITTAQVTRHRINVDTGAYMSDLLSAVRLYETEQSILTS